MSLSCTVSNSLKYSNVVVCSSGNGRSYVITIVPTGDVTYIAGGITQTEKI